jgi:selenocysteine-specific elongation factor
VLSFLELYGGFACPWDVLFQGLGVPDDELRRLAAGAPGVLPIPDAAAPETFTTAAKWERLETAARELVGAFHASNPMAPGMEMESLRTSLPEQPDQRVFRWALERLISAGALVRDESVVRLPGHRVALDGRRRVAGDRIEAALRAAGLTPPDVRTLEAEGLSPKELADVLQVLEREGRVVRVAADMYYAREAVERGIELLRGHCAVHGEITAAAFRDLIGASRKYSIAFLDYCDRTGVTLRVGDVRRMR